MSKLKDRIENYISLTDYKLMEKVPIIMCINGRNFSKATQLLDKPYCAKFSECMLSTMLRLCSDVEGAIFAYHHNDEIILMARNDQSVDTDSWFGNRLQKICSATSAIATMHFNECASKLELNMSGSPIFI